MTALTIYEPFRGLFPHRRFYEDFFKPYMYEGISEESSTMTPRVDVSENDNEYHVLADLPGFKQDEVDIEVNDGYLKMTAHHEGQKEEKKEKYLIQERCYGTWSRTFRLPEDVSSEGVKADMSEGILDVTLPKKEESKPKRIEVKVH
jgi:HSP20 family protein